MKLNYMLGDILEAPKNYTIATTISADFSMGSGVAKQIEDTFAVKEVLQKKYPVYLEIYPGGTCLMAKGMFFLVDKPKFKHKARLCDIEASLYAMRVLAQNEGIYEVAMPLIGCGCEKFDWKTDILPIFERVFADSDIELFIYMIDEDLYEDFFYDKCAEENEKKFEEEVEEPTLTKSWEAYKESVRKDDDAIKTKIEEFLNESMRTNPDSVTSIPMPVKDCTGMSKDIADFLK